MDISREFILAGNAVFTIELPADFRLKHNLSPHYTFRVKHKEANNKYRENWFVSFLTGPNNTEDYTYLGTLNPRDGQLKITKGKLHQEHILIRLFNRVLALVWNNDVEPMKNQGFDLHHEGHCGRCGRSLTTPLSIERGIGPECWTILHQ